MSSPPRSAAYAVFWAVVPALLGCTRLSDNERFESNPQTVEILTTEPKAAEMDVSLRPQLDLCWSGLIDPRSLGDLDALVSSGNSLVDTELDLQLRPWRGPNNAPLPPDTTAPWCAGSVLSVTPRADLVAGVRYRLQLDETAIGWAGEAINTESEGWIEEDNDQFVFQLEFTTALAPSEPPKEPPPTSSPTLTELFAPGELFDPERASCSCHRDPDDDARVLLDLSSPELAFNDLVRVVEPHDTGFPMITPRRPSESFLLQKLLRDRDGAAIFGVRGVPMPKDADPIPYADYVAIARWIEAGAKP